MNSNSIPRNYPSTGFKKTQNPRRNAHQFNGGMLPINTKTSSLPRETQLQTRTHLCCRNRTSPVRITFYSEIEIAHFYHFQSSTKVLTGGGVGVPQEASVSRELLANGRAEINYRQTKWRFGEGPSQTAAPEHNRFGRSMAR